MRDSKYLVFFHMCLVVRMEKLRDEKLICLVENTNEMIENVVCTNFNSYL